MKKIILSIAAAIGLLGLGAGNVSAAWVNTNAMLVQIQMSGLGQTNASGTIVTNAAGVQTTTISATPVALTTKDLLKMLEVEFNTNFPAGAQLAYGLAGGVSGFFVTDASGNPILDVSSNPSDSSYVLAISNGVVGSGLLMQYGKIVNNTVTTNVVAPITQIFRNYGFFYSDSHGNDINFVGDLTAKITVVQTPGHSRYKIFNLTQTGSGGGTLTRNGVPTLVMFTHARLTGAGKNIGN